MFRFGDPLTVWKVHDFLPGWEPWAVRRLIRASGRWMRWMCCNIGWISKSFPRSRHETNVCKITMKQFSNTQAYVNWLDEKWRWTWSYQRSHDEKGVYVFGPVVDQHRMGNLLQDYVKDDEHLAICLVEWCFEHMHHITSSSSSSKCRFSLFRSACGTSFKRKREKRLIYCRPL